MLQSFPNFGGQDYLSVSVSARGSYMHELMRSAQVKICLLLELGP